MDADQYSEAIQYEQLTQAVYQAILQKEGVVNAKVEHTMSGSLEGLVFLTKSTFYGDLSKLASSMRL